VTGASTGDSVSEASEEGGALEEADIASLFFSGSLMLAGDLDLVGLRKAE
jgi:hypothetical protein